MPGNGKLNKDLIEDAAKYTRAGLKNRDVCAVLGVHESTYYKWLQEPRSGLEEELFKALKKARAERKAFMLQTITESARDGTWQAAAWWLERVYPKEFAKPDRYHDQGIEEAVKAVKELTESIKAQSEKA